jgi:hypothetical protein
MSVNFNGTLYGFPVFHDKETSAYVEKHLSNMHRGFTPAQTKILEKLRTEAVRYSGLRTHVGWMYSEIHGTLVLRFHHNKLIG